MRKNSSDVEDDNQEVCHISSYFSIVIINVAPKYRTLPSVPIFIPRLGALLFLIYIFYRRKTSVFGGVVIEIFKNTGRRMLPIPGSGFRRMPRPYVRDVGKSISGIGRIWHAVFNFRMRLFILPGTPGPSPGTAAVHLCFSPRRVSGAQRGRLHSASLFESGSGDIEYAEAREAVISGLYSEVRSAVVSDFVL